MTAPLDASNSKPLDGGPSFPFRHRLLRAIWNATWLLLASWTPRQLYRWRRFLLRAFGAKLGRNTDVLGSARVWYPPNLVMEDNALIAQRVNCYNMGPIRLGEGALVSQDAYLCAGTHDCQDPKFQLVVEEIVIGRYAWVAARAFVGPGVHIGEGAVLGASAVAFRDLPPWTISVGNPAVVVKARIRQVVSRST